MKLIQKSLIQTFIVARVTYNNIVFNVVIIALSHTIGFVVRPSHPE